MIPSPFFNSMFRRSTSPWAPLLFSAATWAALLTVAVAVAFFSPEVAFVSVITPTSAFSLACEGEGAVRIPLDAPSEVFCLPAHMFQGSKLDPLVPPVCLAVIVAGSACVVRSLGFWDVIDDSL